jgi:hypothetical protein
MGPSANDIANNQWRADICVVIIRHDGTQIRGSLWYYKMTKLLKQLIVKRTPNQSQQLRPLLTEITLHFHF